jgi:YD repeat-containing protein
LIPLRDFRAVPGGLELGYRSTNIYDAASQVIATISAAGRQSTTVFDEVGQVVAQVTPLGSGARETMTYNADLRQHWKE